MTRRGSRAAGRPAGTRLLAGHWRGRRLATPEGIRPTQARVREALFSYWGDQVLGCRFLELYAGSACVSLEALSRGAESALAIDRDPGAHRCMEANRTRLGADGLRLALARLPEGIEAAVGAVDRAARFDLAFVDPPYDIADMADVMAALEPFVAEGGEAVLEHSSRRSPPPAGGRLELRGVKRYGDAALAFYR